MNLDAQRQKLEGLTTADHAFDALSGAVVRLFVRLEEIEAALRRLTARLHAIEKARDAAADRHGPPPDTAGGSQETPATTPLPATSAGGPFAVRRRGRPPGVRDAQPRTRRTTAELHPKGVAQANEAGA